MQKVYLLLRSNKQTGPYSLEELLQLNLKPFDLVWMEGRSAAWQYPSEIPSLKPYVPETPQTNVPFQPIATSAMEENFVQTGNLNSNTQSEPSPQIPTPQKTDSPKRVFVSIPKTYTPSRSESNYPEQSPYAPKPQPNYGREGEVKTTAATYSQPTHSYQQQKPVEEEVRTNYSRSMNDVEEDYTSWVYNKKTKKKASVNPKELVLAALILAVIGGGYYVMSKPSVANSILPANKVATQTNEQTAESNTTNFEEQKLIPKQKTAPALNDISATTEPKSKTIKTKNPVIVSKTGTNSSVPSSQNSMPVEKTNPNIHDDNTDVVFTEPEVKQQPKETTSPEKKKKFGEVLKGIFSKKEKKEETAKTDEPITEDPKPANNRQATRREDDENSSNTNTGANEVNTASLMEQIDLSSNAPDNWMLGVKNLKITLRNRSNVTIQTASVLVSYYNENNDLLEKKLVYFNNVGPKSKAIAVAPDSKFADHVEYKLASASAKEDRYATK
jgi:hypothetical protein